MDALRKYKHFFAVLAVAKPDLRRALLLKADDALLRAIIEVILNTVKCNIPVPSAGVKKLKRYRSELRSIAQGYNKKTKPSLISQRKRLLQKGGGYIPTIFSNISTVFEQNVSDGLRGNDFDK